MHSYSIKHSHEELHQRLIVSPTDKTNRNAALVFKRICAPTLMKQQGLRGNHVSTPKSKENCEERTSHSYLTVSHGNTI